MADTLAAQSMRCVLLTLSLIVGSCAWVNLLSSQKNPLHMSMSSPPLFGLMLNSFKLVDSHFRERREHRVFQQLLDMVPGLEDRLLDGSNEDNAHIADLVGSPLTAGVHAHAISDSERRF